MGRMPLVRLEMELRGFKASILLLISASWDSWDFLDQRVASIVGGDVEKLWKANILASAAICKNGGVTKPAKAEPSVHKDPLFDELADDTLDYMDTENAQDVGRIRNVVYEEEESVEDAVSTEDVFSTDKEKVSTDRSKVSTDRSRVSTDKEEVSTDRPDKGTDDQTKGRYDPQTPPATTTPSIFGDDETIAQVLIIMSQNKEKLKEKGVEHKDVEETERPRPTSTRSLLTLKPLPKIDPKDKGKKKIEEEESLYTLNPEVFLEAKKKFKQLARDEEMARKKHSDLKNKTFKEIQALYEKVKRFDESFTVIGSNEDERKIKEMNEGASDPDKKKKVVKEDVLTKEIVRWRLYEAYGVYILDLEDGTVIHMLVERRYPLSKGLLQRMLDFGLEVEIPPKKSRGKGSQRKKTADDSQETVDISEESEPKLESVKRKTSSKRRVKKKVTLSADDNIIVDDPNTESIPEPTKRRKSGKVTSDPPKKLKGVPSLTLEEQEAVDIMQALKESKKTSKRQPGTGGSNEGTSTIPRVPDESTVISATSSEGTGTKPGVPDEEKEITKENVILEWGSEQESEYSEEDKLDDEEKDDKEGDVDDEDDETESDEDDIYKYKIRVRKDEDEEMINAEVDDSDKGDEEVTDAAKADAEKTSEVKDDPKKTELPPTSSSLYVSSGFGDQFLKLSSDSSLVSTVKDTIDAEINSLLEVKIQSEVPHNQSTSMLMPKKQTPTVDLEQESKKSPSEILKIKTEQAEKQKMLKFTIKSTDKAALKEYDQKSALYQTMHANKSFNRNPANHRLYHALMEALIDDENVMDKGAVDTIQDHKRKYDDDEDDDDEDPPTGPNQSKQTKRRRTKDSESSKKPSTTKETPKGKASSKGSKTGKYAFAKEPVEEPIDEVVMDNAGDDDQPQDASKPKTTKTPNQDWFKQPPRPPTPDPEWNKHQDPLTYDDLMATLIDFSKYVLNRLKIDNLTHRIYCLVCLYLLKGTCSSSIELEYHFQECFNALTDRLDWNNPEGDRYPFDLSKPLPLQGHPGHLTVAADYFFNNDLEYLKSSDPKRTYTTSITKTKAARYEIEGIEDMVPTLWSPTKVGSQLNKFSKHNVYSTKKILGVKSVSVKKLHGYGHLEEIMVKRADRQFYKFKEGDFVDLHLNDIEDMLLLAVQHKLFHIIGSDIVDFIVALRMFKRSLVIKKRVEDL
ncbi:hypothetical protein Tco_0791921 [Tanacetum coccineum]